MFVKQNQFAKLIAITLMAFIVYSCENESLEPDADVIENQSFSFRNQDSLNVSEDVAITAALNFGNGSNLIESGSNLRTASQEVEIDEVIIVPDEQGEPAIYVINYVGTGYIVLSATLKESPVLGFSDIDHFDVENIPLGMAEWFYDRMNKIQVIKSDSSYQIPEEVYGEWSDVLGTDIEPATSNARVAVTIEQHGPLLNTLWGQWSPYNNLVPLTCGTGRAPTGCVATAIGQVARYHARGGGYNWSIMPNNSWTGRTTSGDREVAELMRDIGSWVGMDYGCDGSGANTGDAVSVFRNRLGYSSGGSYQTLSIEDAEPKVKADIKAGRPVIMAGNHGYYTYTTGALWWKKTKTAYTNGHAWVCDGYKIDRNTITFKLFGKIRSINVSSDFYHMNWGWSGTGMRSHDNNGWFRFDNIAIQDPSAPDIKGDGNGSNFQYNRRYITGIRP